MDGAESEAREAETSRWQHAGFAEAVVASVGPDDEMVEQRDVDHVGRLGEPLGESGIVCTRGGVPTGVVVRHQQGSRAGRETRRDKDVGQRDARRGPRAARQHVPGQQSVAGGEAGDREDLDGFLGEERRQCVRGDARIAERESGQADGLALIVAEGAVGADELADAMAAGWRQRVNRHGRSPGKRQAWPGGTRRPCRDGGVRERATNGRKGWTGNAARTGGHWSEMWSRAHRGSLRRSAWL